MAAIWLLLFDESKAMINVRSLGASIPEQGDVLVLQAIGKSDWKSEGLWQMIEKRYCDVITGRIASAATKAGRFKLILATVAVMSVLLVTAHVFHVRSLPAPPGLPVPMQSDAEPLGQIDGGEPSLLGDAPLVGRLTTQAVQTESPPPFGIPVGRPPDENGAPDLSTPAVAVYETLALIDRGDTDRLIQCFANETQDAAGGLYPQHLGHPIELVNVIEEANAAKVTWKATVHTGFSLGGRNWSPGESMILTTRLVRVDGLWKLSKLHDGDEHGPHSHDASTN